MHAARREALAVGVLAAMRGGRLTVTDLGRSIPTRVSVKHCIKRADRLLSNRHLHQEGAGVYTALAQLLVARTPRPVIVVDWSDLDASKPHFLLRASVAARGRALTLYEEVHTPATKDKPKTHAAFLDTLAALLPAGSRPLLITDAGFRTPWFRQVERRGWDWVGRIRHRHRVQLDPQREWVACKSLYGQATATPRLLGWVRLTESRPIDCHLVLYQGKPKGRSKLTRLGRRAQSRHSKKNAARAREPWLLATSLPETSKLAKKVVRLYARRMQIEEAFRDLKSHRFGLSLEYSGTRERERLEVLLLIATLALLVLWLLGRALELSGQHRAYQPNTVRSRHVFSTLFIALQTLNDARVTVSRDLLLAAAQDLRAIIGSAPEAEEG
jgi:hypothetical protein